VDFKAGYVPGHSDSVAYLLSMMGREAGYSPEIIGRLELAAYLHDVGKIRLPDTILLAERPLSDEEFDRIKQHPRDSAAVAGGFAELEDVGPWVLHHHEHFDGSGYPDGLRAEEIPWPSRMLLVADAFQVMTTDRPYREARTRREALHILEDKAGSQFCPHAVGLLMARDHWTPADPPLSAPPTRIWPGGDVVSPGEVMKRRDEAQRDSETHP